MKPRWLRIFIFRYVLTISENTTGHLQHMRLISFPIRAQLIFQVKPKSRQFSTNQPHLCPCQPQMSKPYFPMFCKVSLSQIDCYEPGLYLSGLCSTHKQPRPSRFDQQLYFHGFMCSLNLFLGSLCIACIFWGTRVLSGCQKLLEPK